LSEIFWPVDFSLSGTASLEMKLVMMLVA
jgi:hypothetical protein